MATFRLSRGADADLLSIGAYTLRTWGQAQAIRYLDELEACCQRLADNPAEGRACDHVRPGLRRMEQGKHVVFFRPEPGGILVSASCTNACCRNATTSTTAKRSVRSQPGGAAFCN